MLGLTINVETARGEVYTWVNQTLRQQGYEGLNRSGRGLERQYMEKMTGRHRARTTWLITMHLSGEEVKPQPCRRRRFTQIYGREDIALLAGIDEAHQTLSGPATKKLLHRACYNFNYGSFRNLAGISVALSVPVAREPRVSRAAHPTIGQRDRRQCRSASGGSRSRGASTQCIRATMMGEGRVSHQRRGRGKFTGTNQNCGRPSITISPGKKNCDTNSLPICAVKRTFESFLVISAERGNRYTTVISPSS